MWTTTTTSTDFILPSRNKMFFLPTIGYIPSPSSNPAIAPSYQPLFSCYRRLYLLLKIEAFITIFGQNQYKNKPTVIIPVEIVFRTIASTWKIEEVFLTELEGIPVFAQRHLGSYIRNLLFFALKKIIISWQNSKPMSIVHSFRNEEKSSS